MVANYKIDFDRIREIEQELGEIRDRIENKNYNQSDLVSYKNETVIKVLSDVCRDLFDLQVILGEIEIIKERGGEWI